MPLAHMIVPTAPSKPAMTVRLGAGASAGDRFDLKELGKAVKLVAESRYNLCAAGDEIEGFIASLEPAPQGGFTIGGIEDSGVRLVVADGLQATPGTGTLAIGDYVVAGTVTAKGTALASYQKVCKATALSVGTTPAVNFPPGSNLNHKWRVESLGPAGTGAVGTVIAIKRVTA